MVDHDQYCELMTDPHDRYKDLEKVFAKTGFNKHNTVIIDTSDDKIQLAQENALVCKKYTL